MKHSVGEIIYTLRKKAGISQKELAEGLLSIAELSRVENEEREEDKFILEALFQRLGKSADHFEVYASAEEYQLLLLRKLIMKNLLDIKLQLTAVLLMEYQESPLEKRSIHEQYYHQMRAVNYFLADGDRKKCIQNLQQALAVTVPETKWKQEKWEGIHLCTQEIQIFLMLGCMWIENEELKKASKVLKKIGKYIDRNVTDEAERAKLLPKCAWLRGEIYYKQGKIEKSYEICDKGKECLAKNGNLIVMDKLLGLEERCLRELGREKEREIIQKQLSAVNDLYSLADFRLPKERILCLLLTSEHSETLISNEVVREIRISCGLSQEELCEDICSRETLSRIENGKQSPKSGKLQAILKRLGEERGRYYASVDTEVSVLHEKVRLYKRSCYQKEREKAGLLLNEIEQELDMASPVNRQFIESNRLTEKVESKEIDYKDAVLELEKILKYTMKNFKGDIYRIPYEEEFIIINCMALYSRRSGNKEEAKRLYGQLLKKYEESGTEEIHHNVPLFLLYINYTGLLEVMDELEEAEKIGKRGLRLMIESQRGDVAAKLLGNISCIHEKKGTVKDNELCEICMRQSYWLQVLYHLEKDSLIIKELYEKKYAKKLD